MVILLIFKEKSDYYAEINKNCKRASPYIAAAFISGALVTIVVKLGADEGNPLWFITMSYGLNIFLVLLFRGRIDGKIKPGKQRNDLKGSMILGIGIGILNFAGFYTLIKAFSTGSLAIVATLVSLSFVIPIMLSIPFFKERVTVIRVVVIVMTIGAALLLRI